MKADRRLFDNMVIIAQSGKLEMRDVLSQPIGPLPHPSVTIIDAM